MPLTTQPPFQPFVIKHLSLVARTKTDHLILPFDTGRMESAQLPQEEPQKNSQWAKTQFAHLIRYEPSGTYFARIRVQGKLILKSLRTNRISVAKLRLAELDKEEL